VADEVHTYRHKVVAKSIGMFLHIFFRLANSDCKSRTSQESTKCNDKFRSSF
jgi:hypothetical protein